MNRVFFQKGVDQQQLYGKLLELGQAETSCSAQQLFR
jgi:hypothetical protein